MYIILIITVGDRTHQSSSKFVGRAGEQLTLLCLADEQIQGATWTGGTTNNITFTYLSSTNAGVYTCGGTTINNEMVSHSVKLTVSGEFVLLSWKHKVKKNTHHKSQ